MPASLHHGVGLIVGNLDGSRFYVQQKDASYPRFPLGYSLFGGACEPNETLREALARELGEELGDAANLGNAAKWLLAAEPRLWATLTVGPTEFRYSLFELRVTDAQLDLLGRARVYEGERGVVVTRAELRALPFIWGLETVIAAYLDR